MKRVHVNDILAKSTITPGTSAPSHEYATGWNAGVAYAEETTAESIAIIFETVNLTLLGIIDGLRHCSMNVQIQLAGSKDVVRLVF